MPDDSSWVPSFLPINYPRGLPPLGVKGGAYKSFINSSKATLMTLMSRYQENVPIMIMADPPMLGPISKTGRISSPPETPQNLSRPEEYVTAKVIGNTTLQEKLAPKEDELHMPRIWNSMAFQEDKFPKQGLKPNFPSKSNVQTSHTYVQQPRQTQSKQVNSMISPSSESVPVAPSLPLIFVPLISSHPTSGDSKGDNLIYQQNIRSISQNGASSTSPATVPHSELPAINDNRTVGLPPPNSDRGHGTAPGSWILPWRKIRAPTDKRVDDRKADVRGQTVTMQTTQIASPAAIPSSTPTQPSSASLPLSTVEFSPTPMPNQLPKTEPLSVVQIPNTSKKGTTIKKLNQHPVQNSTASSNSNSHPRQKPVKLPAPRAVRRGYWNRRGDHLTSDGYLVFPPPGLQYPDELKTYPKQGYRNHIGLYISYVRRPELPQSLAKDGKPPERPYESFVVYMHPSG